MSKKMKQAGQSSEDYLEAILILKKWKCSFY